MTVLTEVQAVLDELGTMTISPQRRLVLLKELPGLARKLCAAYESLGDELERTKREEMDLRAELAKLTKNPRWVDPGLIYLAAVTDAGAVVR
jgi:hypothetical protein